MINFTEEQIKRVAQVVAEDTQSRKGIREEVVNEMKRADDPVFIKMYEDTCIAINTWINKKASHDSKQIRLNKLKNIVVSDIALEMFVAICIESGRVPIQKIVNKLSQHLPFSNDWDNVKTAGELLVVCVDVGFYNLYMPKSGSGESIQIESLMELDPKTIKFIDKTQYMNPMLVRPDSWTDNRNGGYLTICEHVVLGRENNHDEYQALDALNILQSVELELDMFTLQYLEESNKPLETQEQKEAFKLMANNSHEVYQEMLDNGNKFHFVAKYDWRGRMYTSGYYINIQSTSFKKSLINTVKKQLIPTHD